MQRRSTGEETAARVALGRALRADPDYVFARLLHTACNEGLDPEPLRRCLRQARAAEGRAEEPPTSVTETDPEGRTTAVTPLGEASSGASSGASCGAAGPPRRQSGPAAPGKPGGHGRPGGQSGPRARTGPGSGDRARRRPGPRGVRSPR
ncbi:DUF4192 family protein [Streptomyces sp. H27-D2]|uniref:DUF4192 family protein n=1 Tax=Streptomyces sp. H27-D2 TaxID=3046304 RepID=UPI002DBEA993|nr:DUF4192 family protein [Streptomyces sp. H27-D2]MEC4015849.1 DUF4192 family protein [Streptomyces sp. H27-D2]